MGKYIGLAIVLIVIILILEWFQIFDFPFLELSDFTAGKEKMYNRTIEAID